MRDKRMNNRLLEANLGEDSSSSDFWSSYSTSTTLSMPSGVKPNSRFSIFAIVYYPGELDSVSDISSESTRTQSEDESPRVSNLIRNSLLGSHHAIIRRNHSAPDLLGNNKLNQHSAAS